MRVHKWRTAGLLCTLGAYIGRRPIYKLEEALVAAQSQGFAPPTTLLGGTTGWIRSSLAYLWRGPVDKLVEAVVAALRVCNLHHPRAFQEV